MSDLPVGETARVTSPSPSPLDTSPFVIEPERWAKAEKAARKILRKVQPTLLSEERRWEVIDYVQKLIWNSLGAEVFPYGSVPLKTYLPDGDIDLTAFGGANIEDKLADEIKFVLEEEEKNKAAEFVVKDVQLIRAEVKLVKCIVQNIVVDVSLNQIGGLSTLCFLEQVDLLIDKDHLFKHSIILIKAWCYYESRILGAHHGLISTYALETLVLYIFHLFHSTLDGPLAVLYKFLDYFSKFDWETYCISLKGPVRLSSLPAIMAEMPEDNGGELLLSSDLLSSWVKLLSIPSRGNATNSRGFQQKHLNIIDPLKENNNLGRSVSKGNFYRIRSAFSYGARKLGRILLQPEDGIANELLKFFSNTMARHGYGQRPDIQDLGPLPTCNELISALPVSETESCKSDQLSCKNCVNSTGGDCRPSSDESSQDVIEGVERKSDRTSGEQTGTLFLGSNHPPKLSNLLRGDANDLSTSGIEGLHISSDSFKTPIPSMKESACATVRPFFAPHLYFSKSTTGNGSMRNRKPESDHCDEGERNDYFVLSSGFDEGRVAVGGILDRNQLVNKDEMVASTKSKDVLLAPKLSSIAGDMKLDQGSTSRSGTPDSLNSLLDLTGDYESYFHWLELSRRCYEHASVLPSFPVPPSPTPPLFQIKNPWDDALPPSQFQSNGFSHQHPNNFRPSSSVYAIPRVLLPGVAFGWEEIPKPRGTGTYFPNTNQPPQGYRPSAMKGRNQAPSRTHHNNGRNTILGESNVLDRSRHEAAQPQVTVDQNVKVGSSNSYQPCSPNSRGLVIEPEPEGTVGFGVRHGFGTSMLEESRQQRPVSSSPRSLPVMQRPQPSSSPRSLPVMQRPQPSFSKEQDRIALKSSYHLKDEDDFPPLSV